jgi:hypothetical protein
MSLTYAIFYFALALLSLFLILAHRKRILHWMIAYLVWLVGKPRGESPHMHLIFCFVDHFEPRWGGARDMPRERERVRTWIENYPALAMKFVDADGCHPKHTFFFPEEEYEEEHLAALQSLCEQGVAEIEVHLHHDDDTSENLEQTLSRFANTLHSKHGALPADPETKQPRYAFIHGNWVLDNSGEDGRWCGVNDEISVLRRTGCYADFTFPCAPHPAQPRQINSIYYAKDDPDQPKSHDKGTPVTAGGSAWGDLMLITGPLTLNWRRRKFGLLPRIENSDIRSSNPPTAQRVDLWVKTGIRVKGRDDWIFVKVHTHGAPEKEAATLLGPHVEAMHSHLRQKYNDQKRFSLHYASAREMYNMVKAAEAGESGGPGAYRDYILPPPRNCRRPGEQN